VLLSILRGVNTPLNCMLSMGFRYTALPVASGSLATIGPRIGQPIEKTREGSNGGW
jgi:hypothetical protein